VASPAVAPTPPPAAAAPVPAPAKPGWRERHAEKKAAEEHAAAVATWQAEQNTLDNLTRAASNATRPETGGGIEGGILLKAGEVALWSGAASLVEPRRQQGHYVGAYSGVPCPTSTLLAPSQGSAGSCGCSRRATGPSRTGQRCGSPALTRSSVGTGWSGTSGQPRSTPADPTVARSSRHTTVHRAVHRV
jgi:hypothetical protein